MSETIPSDCYFKAESFVVTFCVSSTGDLDCDDGSSFKFSYGSKILFDLHRVMYVQPNESSKFTFLQAIYPQSNNTVLGLRPFS